MAFNLPTRMHSYMGEFASDAAATAGIVAAGWDDSGNPFSGMIYFDTIYKVLKVYRNEAWVIIGLEYGEILKEPTGFRDRIQTTISYDSGTKTFTLAKTGASFDFYISGQKYTKTSDQNVVLTGLNGEVFVYFNIAGTLVASSTRWDLSSSLICPVAIVYHRPTSGEVDGWICDCRHLTNMSLDTVRFLDDNIGLERSYGLRPVDYDLDTDTNAAKQKDWNEGALVNQDIYQEITDSASPSNPFEQDLTPLTCQVYYLTWDAGNSANYWKRDSSSNLWFKYTASGRLNYNKITVGSPDQFSQQETTDNYYVAYWICATMIPNLPIISVQGQREDANLAEARRNNTWLQQEWNDWGYPIAETTPLFRIILKTSNSYSSTGKCVVSDVTSYRDVDVHSSGSDFRQQPHAELDGNTDWGAHPASAIDVNIANFDGLLSSSDNNIQNALETIDNINASNVPISKIGSATYDRIQEFLDKTASVGIVVPDEGDSLLSDGGSSPGDVQLDIASVRGFIKTNTNQVTCNLKSFDLMGTTLTTGSTPGLTDQDLNYIYLEYVTSPSEAVEMKITTDIADINNYKTKILIGWAFVYNAPGILAIENVPLRANDLAGRLYTWILNNEKAQHVLSGNIIGMSDYSNRYLEVTAGTMDIGLTDSSQLAFDSNPGGGADGFYEIYHTAGGVWTNNGSPTITQIDNTNYNGPTSKLAMTAGNYGCRFIYRTTNGTVGVVFGSTNGTFAEALDETPSFDFPEWVTGFYTLIGKIIIKKSATSYADIYIIDGATTQRLLGLFLGYKATKPVSYTEGNKAHFDANGDLIDNESHGSCYAVSGTQQLTDNSWTKASNISTTSDLASNFTHTAAAGKLLYSGSVTKRFHAIAHFIFSVSDVSSARMIFLGIGKDGSNPATQNVGGIYAAVANAVYFVSAQGLFSLSNNNYFEIYFQNAGVSGTFNVVVSSLYFTITEI